MESNILFNATVIPKVARGINSRGLSVPYVIVSHDMHIATSMGVTIHPIDGKTFVVLRQQTGIAEYRYKDTEHSDQAGAQTHRQSTFFGYITLSNPHKKTNILWSSCMENPINRELVFKVKQNISGIWYVMEVNYTNPTAYFDRLDDARAYARYLVALNTGSKLEIFETSCIGNKQDQAFASAH